MRIDDDLLTNQIRVLDKAVRDIIENAKIGIQKQGDLSAIRVYKLNILQQQYLLAYQATDTTLILHALSSHENFYRDLKLSLKN